MNKSKRINRDAVHTHSLRVIFRTTWVFSWPIVAGLFFFAYFPLQTIAQENGIEASIKIGRAASDGFCKDLREAVAARDVKRVSKWMPRYPIEVQRGNEDVIIIDGLDFAEKFDFVFDAAMKSILFGSEGCEPKSHEDFTLGLAKDQILICQTESMQRPGICAISPPKDVHPFLIVEKSKDDFERGADKFFKELQGAIKEDNRSAVAAMCTYPIRVSINGKEVLIQNHTEFVEKYSQIFTRRMKKVVSDLPSPIHMGWRGFMTDKGELWLDSVAWTHLYRVEAINGPFNAKRRAEKKY